MENFPVKIVQCSVFYLRCFWCGPHVKAREKDWEQTSPQAWKERAPPNKTSAFHQIPHGHQCRYDERYPKMIRKGDVRLAVWYLVNCLILTHLNLSADDTTWVYFMTDNPHEETAVHHIQLVTPIRRLHTCCMYMRCCDVPKHWLSDTLSLIYLLIIFL